MEQKLTIFYPNSNSHPTRIGYCTCWYPEGRQHERNDSFTLVLVSLSHDTRVEPVRHRSVIGRFLHALRWLTLLSADSASIRSVPRHIVLITRLKPVLARLAAIAAVVTPPRS